MQQLLHWRKLVNKNVDVQSSFAYDWYKNAIFTRPAGIIEGNGNIGNALVRRYASLPLAACRRFRPGAILSTHDLHRPFRYFKYPTCNLFACQIQEKATRRSRCRSIGPINLKLTLKCLNRTLY